MPVIAKNTCQYKLQNGANKGKLCGNPCKEDYCYRHTEKTIKKKKEYGSKTKKLKTIKKIKDETDINKLPKLEIITEKISCTIADLKQIRKKQCEIKFKLGEINEEKYYGHMRIICYGSCKNKKEEPNIIKCDHCTKNKYKKCFHCENIDCKHCNRVPIGFDLINAKLNEEQLRAKYDRLDKKYNIKMMYCRRLSEKKKIIIEKMNKS